MKTIKKIGVVILCLAVCAWIIALIYALISDNINLLNYLFNIFAVSSLAFIILFAILCLLP